MYNICVKMVIERLFGVGVRKMSYRSRRNYIILVTVFLIILKLSGIISWLFEKDYYTEFNYPYDVDLEKLIYQLRNGEKPSIKPYNEYNYNFIHNQSEKCKLDDEIRVVYLIKSDPDNFKRRIVIRNTWGYEKRFSDVEIRTIFLLGYRNNMHLQQQINDEAKKHSDIVQSTFIDAYYNNTIKTMMGMKWAVNHCSNANYYMFVDDDYYVSTKNVLRFIRHPTKYPKYVSFDYKLPADVKLYAGTVFQAKPLRYMFSKWYVSLDEYQYNYWPPFIPAGAYVLSQSALLEMYYASLYTKHFRFDDVYMGILALRTNIPLFHCNEFYFYKKPYKPNEYNSTIASHGFGNPRELLSVWNVQRSLGYA